jgi:hypothetical protein
VHVNLTMTSINDTSNLVLQQLKASNALLAPR